MKRANIIKPQNAFERKVDNFDTGAFKPLLFSKPHATVSLDKSLITYVDDFNNPQYANTHALLLPFLTPNNASGSTAMGSEGTTTAHAASQETKQDEPPNSPGFNKSRQPSLRRLKSKMEIKFDGLLLIANGKPRYKHPYETEIQSLEYPKQVFEKRDPIPYLDVDKSNAVWVDTYEGVLEMLGELKKAKEIAVDLEHHDYRSYPGLLSLMQISTREKDWIVDTLRPWRHKLEVLNEVFADPKIIKVHNIVYSWSVLY